MLALANVAILLACPALHSVQGSACCSGYLLPSIKTPLQKIHRSLAAGSGQCSHIFFSSPLCLRQCLLLWMSAAEYQNGISATCRCRRSIGALLLALANVAMFLACPALHSVQGSACCSGYLLPSIQTESLQLAVAEDPSEPCCWLCP